MKVIRQKESGNALVYVLIAIALFAALGFTLNRQTDESEAGALNDERAEIYATQLISYAVQARSVVDQMIFSGTRADEIDFTLPNEGTFNSGTQADKARRIYHPEGGGLNAGRIPEGAIDQNVTDPVAGWYLGRFNNVDWTPLGPGNTEGVGGTEAPYEEIILTAYQISRPVCEKINEKLTGNATIPTMGDSIKETLIDDRFYTGTNVNLTTILPGSPVCAECNNRGSLCVESQAQNAYGFYSILADQ